ncbi:MAG: hypothetical protein MUE36_06830 [Acidimicrobiales bacterium]|jgi:hypothetical protein|nr:hypothetical protein [Acidimicrobiales bacterium]
MAAPDYVPAPTDDKARVYVSPPWRPDSWMADRPAELAGRQPSGPGLGSPGPDQGYALKLANQFRDRLVLTPGEHEDDALAGCLAIAMRRAALFGRAPMIHDLTVALGLWSYLVEPPADLAVVRRAVFAGVASTHHYTERRAIADGVPEDVLRRSPAEISELTRNDPSRVVAIATAIRDGADLGAVTH